jgi:hypothetical protein
MQNFNAPSPAAYSLPGLLDKLSAFPILDFDPEYEELDREFAEIRLHFNHQ